MSELATKQDLSEVRSEVHELQIRMDARFAQVDTRLVEFERRVDARFEHVERQFDTRLDGKLADLERRVTVRMLAGIAAVSAPVKLL